MKLTLTGQSLCALTFFVLLSLTFSQTTVTANASAKTAGKDAPAKRRSASADKPRTTSQKSGAAEAQVRAVLDAQVIAWNDRNLDEFMKGYWNSSDLTFFSGGAKLAGWEATMARYRKNYQSEGREMGRLTFSDLEIMPLGLASAFVRGRWKLVMSDGKTPGGLFTLLFRKFDDGWKIIHDHTSSNQ